MNSTLKIDYDSQTGRPVIKIIFDDIPKQVFQENDTPGSHIHDDEDVRDKLIREFLHNAIYSEPYEYYQKGCCFPIKGGKKFVTIEPVLEDSLFYRFRHSLLNRFVPYDTLVALNNLNQAIKNGEKISTPGGNSTRKSYPAEDLAHKINEFFDWIEQLEYATQEQRYPDIRQF